MKEKEILIPSYENEEEQNITIEQEQIKQNFIIVYDSIYKNSDLNANEIAILIYLLSRSPTFKPNAKGLMHNLKISENKYFKTIKSLQEKGYLKIERNRNEYKYIVYQKPPITPEHLTFEYLKKYETFNIQLWHTLLKTHQISKDLYYKLCDNLKEIVNINWINKD